MNQDEKKLLEDSQNTIDQYKRLVKAQDEQIKLLKNKELSNFVYVTPPKHGDEREYSRVIGNIGKNDFSLFYLSRLQYSIISEFTSGKGSPEFQRGQLSVIARILNDSARERENETL